jgi:hypothetical protein
VCKAVRPSLVLALTSAPLVNRNSATSLRPAAAAECNGVQPPQPKTRPGLPFTSILTFSKSPLLAKYTFMASLVVVPDDDWWPTAIECSCGSAGRGGVGGIGRMEGGCELEAGSAWSDSPSAMSAFGPSLPLNSLFHELMVFLGKPGFPVGGLHLSGAPDL